MITKTRIDENGKETTEYEGFCVDLAEKIAEVVNFDYVIKPVKDNRYGNKDENGTWNGMVGELVGRVSCPFPFRLFPFARWRHRFGAATWCCVLVRRYAQTV